MEPRIQYAQTSDGVSIAYWAIGEGLPVIAVPPVPWTHLQLEWEDPDYRAFDERLARGKMLVRYDNRGSGLSDREIPDFSLEALLLDIDAVADRLGLERFALAGITFGGPVAMAYAARWPERVSHLILWCSLVRWADTASQKALRELRQRDWEMFTETVAHATAAGWAAGEQARRYARLMREAVSPEVARAGMRTLRDGDVTPQLSRIACPTLVLHRRDARFPPPETPRLIASRIPEAELIILEGEALLPWVGDMEAAVSAIDRFLGVEVEEPPPLPTRAIASGGQPGAVHTILFTDVEGSTALTQRLGDAKAREVMREHERITRECLRAHAGSEVKTMGDGFMASFTSATRALECAVAMQQAFEERSRRVGAQQPREEGSSSTTSPAVAAPLRPAEEERPVEPIHIRIGLNAGEPIAEEDDLFGTAVITAARIAAQAQGGEILVSDVVRQLVAGKGFLFSDRGEHALRGFEDPVRVYEVRWRDA